MSIHGAVSSRAFDFSIEVKSVSAVGRGGRWVLGFSSGDGDSASVGILRAMVSFDQTRGSVFNSLAFVVIWAWMTQTSHLFGSKIYFGAEH